MNWSLCIDDGRDRRWTIDHGRWLLIARIRLLGGGKLNLDNSWVSEEEVKWTIAA